MNGLAALAPAILARYPENRSRSALLPLLRAAQERDGYVTRDAIDEIAEILGITAAEISGVASFYHMLKLAPKGRQVISVCHNLACTLLGAEEIIGALEQHFGIRAGETTPDGEFTLERAECLAACDLAPMLQVDYDEVIGPVSSSWRPYSTRRAEPQDLPVLPEPEAPSSEGFLIDTIPIDHAGPEDPDGRN